MNRCQPFVTKWVTPTLRWAAGVRIPEIRRWKCQLGWQLAVLALLASGCRPQPDTVSEAGPTPTPDAGAGADGGGHVTLAMDRSFGQEGEVPAHLVLASPGRLFALTQRALYLLDDQGRVVRRAAWPAATAGSTAPLLVHAARWDGAGLGLTARWAGDGVTAAGTYLALTDRQGRFQTKAMIKVVATTGLARGVHDGKAHQVLWTQQKSGALALSLTGVSRTTAGVTGTSSLADKLPAGTGVGGAVAGQGNLALCTADPGGAVSLRRFTGGKAAPAVKLSSPDRVTMGPCNLATSGRSHLLTFYHQALAPSAVDWGVPDPDLGPGTVTYPVPMAQVISPAGKVLAKPLRLDTEQRGTVHVEDLLWDGSRYMVLLNRAGYRGGRLVLVLLDEAGQRLASHTLPLAYEPGRLLAARLARSSSDLVLLYSTRRPWDSGVLHLARFTVRP